MDTETDGRFRRLERRLDGNGGDPEFVRTDVYNLMMASVSKDLGMLDTKLNRLLEAQASGRRWLFRLVVGVVVTATFTTLAGVIIASVTK